MQRCVLMLSYLSVWPVPYLIESWSVLHGDGSRGELDRSFGGVYGRAVLPLVNVFASTFLSLIHPFFG